MKSKKKIQGEWESSSSSCQGGWDGAVARALASHQCGPGSIPGVDSICAAVKFLARSQGFSPGTLVFLSTKTNISAKFQIDLERTVIFERLPSYRELFGANKQAISELL